MYDLRKLEIFCKVCELKSFSRAGEALFLSQPTVSAHIQSLERSLNTKLFDRMSRNVMPTQAGHILFQRTKEAFSCLLKAQEEIDNLFSDMSGEMHLGSTSIPAHHILPKMLTLFLEIHPKVQPSLIIDTSSAIAQKVLDGEIYAGIVSSGSHHEQELNFTPFFEDEIVVIAPTTIDSMLEEAAPHAKSGASSISFETATLLPWIIQEENSSTRHIFEKALKDKGYDPRELPKRLTVDNAPSVVQYVSAGLGISIASRLSVEDALRGRRLRALRIKNVKATRVFSYIINTKRALFPATSLFLEFLREQASLLHPPTGL